MYAIVEIAGQQFKVVKDQQIFVHRLPEDEGANVEFENVSCSILSIIYKSQNFIFNFIKMF